MLALNDLSAPALVPSHGNVSLALVLKSPTYHQHRSVLTTPRKIETQEPRPFARYLIPLGAGDPVQTAHYYSIKELLE